MRRLAFFVLGVGLLAGCSSNQVLIPHSVQLVAETETVPEDELLDVSVVVFDPGVPEGEIEKEILEELLDDGTFVHIRRTEARYLAVHLRDTLQNSGHWGAVWATPEESTAADINVTGEILHSDGSQLRLKVLAFDSTGEVWVDDEYFMETAAGAFNRQQYPGLDPYQDVFNRVANDLAVAKSGRSPDEKRNIRTVSQLRFAGELSPEAFGDYVTQQRNGRYSLNRLPAEDDPQFERTLLVRDREHLFVDTLNEHYVDFYRSSLEPYHGWREFAREESIAIRELQRSSRWRTGLGIAGILASVVYGINSDGDFADRVVRDSIMYMSMEMLQSGMLRRQEKQLHSSALEELSVGFDEEVKPMVVEIEGVQHRFTGTAAAQYEDWRGLLRQIYIEETGLGTLDVYTETDIEETDIEEMATEEAVTEEAVTEEAVTEEAEAAAVTPEAVDSGDDSVTPADTAGAVPAGAPAGA